MNILNLSFAPKAVGAVSSVAALVCGSTFLYYESLPKDWKAALSREGIVLLSSDSENAYKAIYLENKDFLNVDLGIDNSKNETEAIKEIQKWCDAELNQEYKPEIVLDREKVIKYCADITPKTLIGVLQKRGISSSGFIGGDGEDYKVMFAVYKYNQTFLDAINKAKKDSESNYSETTEASSGYERLKTWCENSLKKPTSEIEGETLYNQVEWWCRPLGYKTVLEKINKDHPTWKSEATTQVGQGTNWEKIKEFWKATPEVYKAVGNNEEAVNSSTLSGDKFRGWCEDTLKKKIYDPKVYKRDYLVAKVVCVEQKVQNNLTTKSLQESLKSSSES